MPQGRYRADLIDVAWAPEHTYGANMDVSELGKDANNQDSLALTRQWGLVTGGITLPNPTFAWTPFFGIGVEDRNMLFPVHGQETLEGGVPSIMLTHDNSRLIFEQMIGLAFNNQNMTVATGATGAVGATGFKGTLPGGATAGGSATNYHLGTSAVAHSSAGVASVAFTGSSQASPVVTTTFKNAPPTHIVMVGEPGRGINPWRSSWAYVGTGGGTTEVRVFQDRDLAIAGWNGKAPTSGALVYYGFFSVQRLKKNPTTVEGTDYNLWASNWAGVNKINHASDPKSVFIRPALVQQSFRLGAKFRADDGSNFITNYTGCKVSRWSMAMDEGQPVTFNFDFIAQDMTHNIGEDNSTAAAATNNARYKAKGVTGTVDVAPQAMIRVTEQPYFFAGAELQFLDTTFARFRSLSISVDNGLDPRYYIRQSGAGGGAVPDRQILYEILEGRRNITISGSLDMDNTDSDAKFLQHLLNQGHVVTPLDQKTLVGISLRVDLRQMRSSATGSGEWDHVILRFPDDGWLTSNRGATNAVGLVLNSANHNIPAPPNVHIPVDIDGFASSMSVIFQDNDSS